MPEDPFLPVSAFTSLQSAGPADADLRVVERRGLGLASVLARKGKVAMLREGIGKLHGLHLPEGPSISTFGKVSFVGIGPGAWFAIGDDGGEFTPELTRDLAGLASVSDQSGGYGVLRLSGGKVRDVLAKGISIDLHPRAFGIGAAAVTAAAHISIILWRPVDTQETPVFEVAVFRSYAQSFWRWLVDSAVESGTAVSPGCTSR